MTTINNNFSNQSQIDSVEDSYGDHEAAWNALDDNGHWDDKEIAAFADKFDDTEKGKNALDTIIDLIEEGKLDKDDIKAIKEHGVNSLEFLMSLFEDDLTLTESQEKALGITSSSPHDGGYSAGTVLSSSGASADGTGTEEPIASVRLDANGNRVITGDADMANGVMDGLEGKPLPAGS